MRLFDKLVNGLWYLGSRSGPLASCSKILHGVYIHFFEKFQWLISAYMTICYSLDCIKNGNNKLSTCQQL